METKERIYGSVFPRGEKLPEMFAKYFTGQAYLARLTHDQALNCPVSNVTFEPGGAGTTGTATRAGSCSSP